MSDLDAAVFEDIFTGEGASQLAWETATPCGCYSVDTDQPEWGCAKCAGTGVLYAAAQTISGLFRTQTRYLSFRREGELAHGDAQLTTPLDVKPGYLNRRVRDRLTVLSATGDASEGRVFFPATQAVPFLFNNVQRAWRVALDAADESQRLVKA